MNDDYRYKGEIGHKLAEAFLLRFLTPARPEPDPGIDALGHLRMQSTDPVCFNFQFKTGRFTVDTPTLQKWVSLVEREPMFLLHIKVLSIRRQEYRFLALHSWLLHHPDWPGRLAKQATLNFNLREFRVVDARGHNFERALSDERARILKQRTLWRTRDSLLVPISELDLFRHFGRLGQIELPAAVLDEATTRLSGPGIHQDLWRLLRNLWALPERYRRQATRLPGVREWLDGISAPVALTPERRERREFRNFVRAMEGFSLRGAAALPGFTYDEISCWRVFVQLFPESIHILKRASQYPEAIRSDQLMAGSLLSSALATSDDNVLARRAQDVLRRLRAITTVSRVYSYPSYRVVRQILFAAAEADGGDRYVRNLLDFIHRHPEEWDLRLNREYYKDRTDLAMVRSTLRKLRRPRERDRRTARISEFFLERFPKALVDRVQQDLTKEPEA